MLYVKVHQLCPNYSTCRLEFILIPDRSSLYVEVIGQSSRLLLDLSTLLSEPNEITLGYIVKHGRCSLGCDYSMSMDNASHNIPITV